MTLVRKFSITVDKELVNAQYTEGEALEYSNPNDTIVQAI